VSPPAVSQPRRGLPAAARTRIADNMPLYTAGLEGIEKACLSSTKDTLGVCLDRSAAPLAITGHSSKWSQILE
jgi:hypothetical protein